MERSPHGERFPYSETFLTYIPRYPVKELPPRPPPLNLFKGRCSIPRAPFIQLSKSSVDEPSSRFPKWGPYGKRCPSPEPFLHILQVPQQGSPPPGSPDGAPTERDARLQCLFYISFKVPSMEAFPPGSLHRAHTERERERDPTFRAPFNHISKSLEEEPTPGCPTESP